MGSPKNTLIFFSPYTPFDEVGVGDLSSNFIHLVSLVGGGVASQNALHHDYLSRCKPPVPVLTTGELTDNM